MFDGLKLRFMRWKKGTRVAVGQTWITEAYCTPNPFMDKSKYIWVVDAYDPYSGYVQYHNLSTPDEKMSTTEYWFMRGWVRWDNSPEKASIDAYFLLDAEQEKQNNERNYSGISVPGVQSDLSNVLDREPVLPDRGAASVRV